MHLSVVMIAGKVGVYLILWFQLFADLPYDEQTYSNSMLYMLNSRTRHRAAGSSGGSQTVPSFNQTMTEMVFDRPTIKSTSSYGGANTLASTTRSRTVRIYLWSVIPLLIMLATHSRKESMSPRTPL